MTAPFSSDNPIVQKIMAGSAPDPIRLAAARAALPIAPEELLHVLFFLHSDANPDVANAVTKTVTELADEMLATQLGGALSPDVLDYYARTTYSRDPVVQAIIAGGRATDGTLEFLGERVHGTSLELLVTNQVALIRAPALMDALSRNPTLNTDQRRRINEVREEFFTKRDREVQRRTDDEARRAALRAKQTWTQEELEKLQEELAQELKQEREAAATTIDHEEPTPSEEDNETLSATQRIMAMSVPEKVLTAIRGSRTERFILIRDSNRLVATSVIKSPKVGDSEVEQYAGMRNVVDEILRFIGHRRDWMRNYVVLHTLIKNPRTPIAIALNLLPRLQTRDLKNLTGDRNVAEVLRRQAKIIITKSGKN